MNINFDLKNSNVAKLGFSVAATTAIFALGLYAGRYFSRSPQQNTDPIDQIVDRTLSDTPTDTQVFVPSQPTRAACSSESRSCDEPNTTHSDKSISSISKDSKTIQGLDLAGRAKVKSRPDATPWLDLASSDSDVPDLRLSFEMPIRHPVLSTRNNPQQNSKPTSERLLANNPFEQVILGSNVHSFIPKLLGNGDGRPDNYQKNKQMLSGLHHSSSQVPSCSSSPMPSSSMAQTSSQSMPDSKDLLQMYFKFLDDLLGVCREINFLIHNENNTVDKVALYAQLKEINEKLVDALRQKMNENINADYLFKVIHQLDVDQSREFLVNLGLTHELIDLVLQSYNAQDTTAYDNKSFDDKMLDFQTALAKLQEAMDELPKKSLVDDYMQAFAALSRSERAEIRERYIDTLPKISTTLQVDAHINQNGLREHLIDSICKQFSKNPSRFKDKKFAEQLNADFFYCLRYLIENKFVRWEQKLEGLPILPDEILKCFYVAGFVDSDLEGYFDLPPKMNNAIQNNCPELESALNDIRQDASAALVKLLSEQEKHSDARFGNLVRFYRNFVIRSQIIAQSLSKNTENLKQLQSQINEKIMMYLSAPKRKDAHRKYQGHNQLTPGTIKAIKNVINFYKIPDRKNQARTFIDHVGSVRFESHNEERNLRSIKRKLAEKENAFIAALSNDIITLINNPNIFTQSQIDFRESFRLKIFERIASFTDIKVSDQDITMNWEFVMPKKTQEFIKMTIDKLQKKQTAVKDNVSSFFTQEDRKAASLISLILCNPGVTAIQLKVMDDRQFYNNNTSEKYLQSAHTLPYPLLFFPASIPLNNLSLNERVFQIYKGHCSHTSSFKPTKYLNHLFSSELKRRNGQLDDRINEGIKLSFRIAQLEFSEVYQLPKFVNSEIDKISEFNKFDTLLVDILIKCVNMQEKPSKLDIYQTLTPYLKGVLREVNQIITTSKKYERLDNEALLRMVMICNVLKSIIVTKPINKTAQQID